MITELFERPTIRLSEMPQYIRDNDVKLLHDGTIEWYEKGLKGLIAHVGDIPAHELTGKNLRAWQLIEYGRVHVSTANTRARAVRAQLNKIATYGFIDSERDGGRDVAIVCRWIQLRPEPKNTVRAMTQQTYDAMFNHANEKHKLMLAILNATGIRRGELVSIKLSKVKFDHKDDKRTCQMFVTGKMHNSRWVGCSGLVADLIWNYKEYQRFGATTDHLFYGRNKSKPMSVYTINAAFQSLAERANITDAERTNPHSLRSKFAIDQLNKGTPSNVCAAMMGINVDTFHQHYVMPHGDMVMDAFLS